MCGIVGGLRLKAASGISPEEQNEILRIMTIELLLLTEERGGDATGFALLFDDGNFRGMKHGEKASKMVQDFNRDSKDNFLALMDLWKFYGQPANIVMGHCRKRTIGLATDNRNNHPFKVDNIVGIHNGSIENHLTIERLLKELEGVDVERDGTVDSEMIFHLLSHAIGKEKILTLDHAEWVVDRLQGKFAVMAANVNNPHQLMMFRDAKPIEIALSKKAGLIFIASERKFFETALFRCRRMTEYYGLDYLPKLDLVTSILPEDHAWIVNLAHTVDEGTSINDLIESRKMSFLSARETDWQTTTTTFPTGYRGQYNRTWDPRTNNTQNQTTTKEPATKKPESTEVTTTGRNCQHLGNGDKKDEPKWIKGKKWCKEKRVYVEMGGSNVPALPPPMATSVPEECRETKVEDPVITQNVQVHDLTDYVITSTSSGKEESRTNAARSTGNETKVVDVDAREIVDDEKSTPLTELLKVYVTRYGHFNTSEGAYAAAETKEDSVGSVEFRFLANRIRRKAMEQAFTDGYNAALEQAEQTSGYSVEALQKSLNRVCKKKKIAETRIKKLKALALFLISTVGHLATPDNESVPTTLDDDFLKELNLALKPQYSLTREEALKLFSNNELKHPFFNQTS
jgi:hypothetical protein